MEFQHLKQFGDGRDLVGFLVHHDLPQDHAVGRGPGADHVQRVLPFGPIQRGAAGLAIHGDDLTRRDLMDGLDPTEEALDELVAVEQGEDPADGVVRGDAIGQLQELLQPVPFGVPELLHGDEVVGAGDHGTDGKEQDVAEFVALTAFDAGVLHGVEVVKEGRRGP
jgi:hypothetical protein